MQTAPSTNQSELRPKAIPSLLAGFDLVATHIWLIVIPVLLDVLLWLGPRLRIQQLLLPLINGMTSLPGADAKDLQQIIATAQQGWQLIAERLNLIAAMRTYPVGIPSLMANWLPLVSPLGKPFTIDIVQPGSAFFIFLGFSVIGILFTAFYFQSISAVSGKNKLNIHLGMLGWYALQLLMLSIILVIAVVFLGVPFLMVVSGITLFSPMIGQISLFFGGLMVIWFIIPMIFSAHGVFVLHMPVFRAILTSIQLVRISLPTTGSFILSVVVISMGLDLLWQVPSENTWLLLVGILGHAFINSSLIAATFVYYRQGIQWMQALIVKNNLAQTSAPDTNQG